MCPGHSEADRGDLFPHSAKAESAHTAHVDGGSRGNPGPSGYGVVIRDASGKKVAELSEYLGHHTNNYAEYQGLLAALRHAAEHKIERLKVISDSELMVRQMKGIYKVKHPELRTLYEEAQQLVRKLGYFEIRHALREHNQDADRLANHAMDQGKLGVRKVSPVMTEIADVQKEFEGVVKNGVIEIGNGSLPDGTRVQVRVKR